MANNDFLFNGMGLGAVANGSSNINVVDGFGSTSTSDASSINNVTSLEARINVLEVQGLINKGYYTTQLALNTAFPIGQSGWFAIVGATNTIWIWDANSMQWVDSGNAGQVDTVFGRTGVITSQNGDYNASQITNTPSGNILGNNVQDAINELDSEKVDKVAGKQLSTEDYTTIEKNKLSTIQSGAEVNVQSDWTETNNALDSFIQNKPTIYTQAQVDILLSVKEDILNKVASFQPTPDNNKYPTEKLVYDNLQTKQPISTTLSSLASYNTNGFITQTATNTFTGRSISGVNGINVTDGDGVSGNPTIAPNYGNTSNTITQGNDLRLGTKEIDETNIGNNRIQVYNQTTQKLEYQDLPVGSTNLNISNITSTTLDITSNTGTDATIPQATITTAGLLNASDKIKLNNTSSINTGDETTSSIKSKLGQSSNISDGWLSSSDWNTFNSKQPAGTYENTINKGNANGYCPLDSSGLVPLSKLPTSAVPIQIDVPNQAARFALTTAQVREGYRVFQQDTQFLYFVLDEENLNNESGYQVSALAIDWSSVQNKPSDIFYKNTDTALQITNTPSGSIISNNVQGAINELDSEKANDVNVVHINGNETIAGNKTFTGTTTLGTTNLSNLTASTLLELDAGKNIISSAKATAFNRAFETNTANIQMDGTVSAGILNTVARGDHKHPSDTTKVDKTQTIAGNTLNGNITQDQITGLSTNGLIKRVGVNQLGIATAGSDYELPITTLDISKGGTNSSTALTNGKVMMSSGGAIVESAFTSTSLLSAGDRTKLDNTSGVNTGDKYFTFPNFASLPGVGTVGLLYLTLDTNFFYRWNGASYTQVNESLVLGESGSTAYRGDRGAIAYDFSQNIKLNQIKNLNTTGKNGYVVGIDVSDNFALFVLPQTFDATVGVGGTYANVKLALDAGKRNIIIVGNAVETANIIVTQSVYILHRAGDWNIGDYNVQYSGSNINFIYNSETPLTNKIKWSPTSAKKLFDGSLGTGTSKLLYHNLTLDDTGTVNDCPLFGSFTNFSYVVSSGLTSLYLPNFNGHGVHYSDVYGFSDDIITFYNNGSGSGCYNFFSNIAGFYTTSVNHKIIISGTFDTTGTLVTINDGTFDITCLFTTVANYKLRLAGLINNLEVTGGTVDVTIIQNGAIIKNAKSNINLININSCLNVELMDVNCTSISNATTSTKYSNFKTSADSKAYIRNITIRDTELTLSNFTVNGTITTAQLNDNEVIAIPQTTANITLNLQNPTSAKTIKIRNTGTVSFVVTNIGTTITPNQFALFYYSGSSFSVLSAPVVTGGGDSIFYNIDYSGGASNTLTTYLIHLIAGGSLDVSQAYQINIPYLGASPTDATIKQYIMPKYQEFIREFQVVGENDSVFDYWWHDSAVTLTNNFANGFTCGSLNPLTGTDVDETGTSVGVPATEYFIVPFAYSNSYIYCMTIAYAMVATYIPQYLTKHIYAYNGYNGDGATSLQAPIFPPSPFTYTPSFISLTTVIPTTSLSMYAKIFIKNAKN